MKKKKKVKARNILTAAERIIELGGKQAKTSQGRSRIDEIRLHMGSYAEPGYGDVELTAFGNWNDITRYDAETGLFEDLDDTPGRVADLLEKVGVALEWGDEWIFCDGCGKPVRTSPSNACWKQYYAQTSDGDMLCGNCIKADPIAYLDSLEGKGTNAVLFDLDLNEYGYCPIAEDLEGGYHPGQDACPEKIAAELRRQGLVRFLFTLDRQDPYTRYFSVWLHEDEIDQLDLEAWNAFNPNGPSRSEASRQYLEEASRLDAATPRDPAKPVRFIDASVDGTPRLRDFGPEEFVAGVRPG